VTASRHQSEIGDEEAAESFLPERWRSNGPEAGVAVAGTVAGTLAATRAHLRRVGLVVLTPGRGEEVELTPAVGADNRMLLRAHVRLVRLRGLAGARAHCAASRPPLRSSAARGRPSTPWSCPPCSATVRSPALNPLREVSPNDTFRAQRMHRSVPFRRYPTPVNDCRQSIQLTSREPAHATIQVAPAKSAFRRRRWRA